MNFKLLLLFLTTFLFSTCAVNKITQPVYNVISKAWIDDRLSSAATQSKFLATHLPADVLPRSFSQDSFRTCNSQNWTSGFYPGSLLYLYSVLKDKELYSLALQKIELLKKEQYNTGTHDLGFMLYCSYGTLNTITPEAAYKQILVNGARSLSKRFNKKVGALRSWGKIEDSTEFKVIIDNMMNLELLMWATKQTGDSSYYKIAVRHANTTMKNHFRNDYSSYHVVTYDPISGAVVSKKTAQGFADESAWARGQSWGLYGFTMMYRETKNKKYLQQAQHIANFLLNNPTLPADKIPYWDYNAPNIPNAPRDASAAAIMSSALLELAGFSEAILAEKYRSVAKIILQRLAASEYTAEKGTNGGFILKHSVANLPANTEVDAALPYADYYYIESLLRYREYLAEKK